MLAQSIDVWVIKGRSEVSDDKVKEDLTGRQQLLRNIIFGWASHFIVLVCGFIIPRQISDNLGAEALGAWDLGWGAVRYLSLAGLGVGPAINRYTALYRSSGDYNALCRSTTAVFLWQLALAFVVVIAAYGISLVIGNHVEFSSANSQYHAENVVFLMGVVVAVKMLGAVFGGTLVGSHRADIQQSITALQDLALAIAMIIALLLGGTLTTLAILVVVLAVLASLSRYWYARRVCPEAEIALKYWHLASVKKMLWFGGKTAMFDVQRVVILQALIFILAINASLVVVAVLNRALALSRHFTSIIEKVFKLYQPITSGLLGNGQREEAKALILTSATQCMVLTLPIFAMVFAYGDYVLLAWMGEGYNNWPMVVALFSGLIWSASTSGPINVIKGFNAHGRLAIRYLVVRIVVFSIACLVAHRYGWNEVSAALVASVSLGAGPLLNLPVFVQQRFGISALSFMIAWVFKPFLYGIPLLVGIVIARYFLDQQMWLESLASTAVLGIAYLVIVWFLVLGDEIKAKVLSAITRSSRSLSRLT